jgi:hypothetical protein
MKIHFGNALLNLVIFALTVYTYIDLGYGYGFVFTLLQIACFMFFYPIDKKTINIALMSDEDMEEWVRDNIDK